MFLKSATSYTCCDIDGAVKLRINGYKSSAPVSIPYFFRKSCERYSSQPALCYEGTTRDSPIEGEKSKWISVSYAEFARKVEQVSLVLLQLGLKVHDVVGIIASNSPEWLYVQFGTICAGGVIFGAHVTSSEEEVEHMLRTSSATFFVVENPEHMAKVVAVRKNLPKLRVIIQLNSSLMNELSEKEGYYMWEDLMIRNCEDFKEELRTRKQKIFANECAMLLYTSGTTGMPKAVMLSHDNIISSTKGGYQTFSYTPEADKRSVVSYLPLCHIVGQIADVFTAIEIGGCIYFADANAFKGTLVRTLQVARPTHFFGVPRIYEKFKEYIIENKVFEEARESLGFGRCKAIMCSGAPLTQELKSFFSQVDMPIRNYYGLSEAGGAVAYNPNIKQHHIGKVIGGTEVKIDPCGLGQEGELCFRGRTIFMGYLNEPKKTNEAIDADGWFHSGDFGYMDSNGYLYITGRIKELVITSGGENVPPVRIEELIKKELPAISNAMVVGDQRKYLTVLLTIKTKMDQNTGRPLDELSKEAIEWLSSLGFGYQKLSEVLNLSADTDLRNYSPKVDQRILDSIDSGIQRANASALRKPHRVQKFVLLPYDFSLSTEELGPTLKVRRHFVMEKYKAVIDNLYK